MVKPKVSSKSIDTKSKKLPPAVWKEMEKNLEKIAEGEERGAKIAKIGHNPLGEKLEEFLNLYMKINGIKLKRDDKNYKKEIKKYNAIKQALDHCFGELTRYNWIETEGKIIYGQRD